MTTAASPRRIQVDANGLRFTALEAGEGPLVLCLHGFPDDATTWSAVMPSLVQAGYRVVAPWVRGYAPTAASPSGCYQSAALGRDVVGLLDALSPGEPAVVVGHDWGAVAAYAAATLAPGRIRRLVTASVPYGPAMQQAFLTDYAQQKRSWYMFFFQGPLAEMAVAHDDLRFIRNLWKDWSPTWDFGDADLAPVLQTLASPGVLEAALGYYRCFFDPSRWDPALMEDQLRLAAVPEPIAIPTLYLHGKDDGCIGAYLADGMEALFPAGLTKVLLDGAGHFVSREKPAEASDRIARFLKG